MDAIKVVVLAGGKGTRLQSEQSQLPKALRMAYGKPLLGWVLDALPFARREDVVLVVGFMKEAVMEAFPECAHAVQEPQLGTGHAVMCAREALEGFDGTVLVCYGDMPLMRQESYQALLDAHISSGAACTILAGTSERDLAFGRIVRDAEGKVLAPEGNYTITIENATEVGTATVIVSGINGGNYSGEIRTVDVHMRRLREKLEDNPAQPEYVLTKWGVGYYFKA